MFVLNGVSHPRSTSRSYLLRSTLPAVYFRPPPATIRRSSMMSSSCTIVTFLESPGSTRRRSVHQPHGESNRKRAKKGCGSVVEFVQKLRAFVVQEFARGREIDHLMISKEAIGGRRRRGRSHEA